MTDEQMIKEIIERRKQRGETNFSDFDWLINHIEYQQKQIDDLRLVNTIKSQVNENLEADKKILIEYNRKQTETIMDLKKQLIHYLTELKVHWSRPDSKQFAENKIKELMETDF